MIEGYGMVFIYENERTCGTYVYIRKAKFSIVASEIQINPSAVFIISTYPSIHTSISNPVMIRILMVFKIECSRCKSTAKL